MMIPGPAHNFQRSPIGERMKRVLGWLDDGSPVFERANEDLETFHILPAPAGWFTNGGMTTIRRMRSAFAGRRSSRGRSP